jgi:hypothetical protein
LTQIRLLVHNRGVVVNAAYPSLPRMYTLLADGSWNVKYLGFAAHGTLEEPKHATLIASHEHTWSNQANTTLLLASHGGTILGTQNIVTRDGELVKAEQLLRVSAEVFVLVDVEGCMYGLHSLRLRVTWIVACLCR